MQLSVRVDARGSRSARRVLSHAVVLAAPSQRTAIGMEPHGERRADLALKISR
jgi:hypothetical protein